MRRTAIYLSMALTPLVSGCSGSGYYAYLGHTFKPPFGSPPTMPSGDSENYTKIRAKDVQQPAPMLYEAGDAWPAPPKAPPTLRQLQQQQQADMTRAPGGYAPLQPLPQLPGYEVPEQQQHGPAVAPSFPEGVVNIPHNRAARAVTPAGVLPETGGNIVVPNGNGTSTVIGPNGSVTTIPTPAQPK